MIEKVEAKKESDGKGDQKTQRRKIAGDLPYTSSPGVLQRILEKIPISEKPSIFTHDFLSMVLGASGGAARPVIPILKATGLLDQGAVPTDLYSQFQTDGGRPLAALSALRKGYIEIFRRNQYAHKADEQTLADIVVSITGLPKGDQIVRYILSTFRTFQNYAKDASEDVSKQINPPASNKDNATSEENGDKKIEISNLPIGLLYNINIVLPETTNIDVYNAIFVSLRGNLLR